MIGSRRAGKCGRFILIVLAVASLACFSVPVLYRRLYRPVNGGLDQPSCPLCSCDCSPSSSLQKIVPGLHNLTLQDCGKDDPELAKEMEKQPVDVLAEELKLQEAVSLSRARHMNYSMLETKRLTSQFQKEAEKCATATETCEEARQRTEAMLTGEKLLTSLWEHRARSLGWPGR
ncbi:uncharacterized protein LOC144709161 [Wolffia australiana]